MYPFLSDGLRWIPSPRPLSDHSGNIRGAYLGPDENIEWFSIRDPGSGDIRIVGYAIRKNRKPAKSKQLFRVK